jgi:hypothetical protein
MDIKSKANLKRLIGCLVCLFLLSGPALALSGETAGGEGSQMVPPLSGEMSLSNQGEGFSLVSELPVRDSNSFQPLDLGAQSQVVKFSDLRPFIGEAKRSQNRGSAFFSATLVSLVGLHAADYYLTVQALKYPQCREGNPLMQAVVKNAYVFAAVKLGISYLSIRYLGSLHKNNPVLAWVATTLANGLLSYAVVNNWNVIQKIKRVQS